MSKELLSEIELDVSHLITEDDTPVDNLPSEKQQRLLVETLYSGWQIGQERKFLAAANVGVFNWVKQNPVVPDMFISLDVEVAGNWWKKEHRSYFTWEFGKPPDLVLEIVSNKEGGENTDKLGRYAWMKVQVYIIYDPMKHIMKEALTIYKLEGGTYQLYASDKDLLPNLRLTLWQGEFESKQDTWLRWTDSQGNLILSGRELAEYERQEKERERQEKEVALARAERLAAKLKELGIDPEIL
ncbi:MAG: Uma2 family endonuclease [Acidobacteria bacterium]|nr:Uma2 family endonuclease [Acidobacteriota bacterium]